MKKLGFSLLLSLLMELSSPAFAQGYLRVDAKRIVNQEGDNVLLRGMGLGGWMLQEGYMLGINGEGQQYRIREKIRDLIGSEKTDEFYGAWLSNHTTKADIDSMKSWGFNSVRLPMHYNLYTLAVEDEPVADKDTWLAKGFALTDSLLSWCKANNMYLILDLHAAPGGQGSDSNISDRNPSKPSLWESEANQKKTVALWRKLAERYANEPMIGAYDIINEPNWGFQDLANDKNGIKEQKNEPLRKLMVDITNAIREVDKKHIIIIEGNGWGNNYNGILPQWDNNMVLSFHKYWNYNDEASIKQIKAFRDQYNIPVWIGETGENSNVWFADAISLFEKNNIGWSWWPLKKLRPNNPLQIRSNAGYEEVLRFWNGKAGKPTEASAYSGLINLAKSSNISANIVHPDVVDAMFRQPFENSSKPYKKVSLATNLSIPAVHYDLGRNQIAYFDNDTANYHISTGKRSPWNRGSVFRNDGVDIKKMTSEEEKYFVSDIEDGEWLQYTFHVNKAGYYHINLLVAADGEGRVSITNVETNERVEAAIPATGGAESWKTLAAGKIRLLKGENKLRVKALKGGYNLAEIQISKSR
jgi:endoglucanase